MGMLDGKVAVVTGGSRGIGAAIVQRLGREGAAVAVNYSRDGAPAEELVEQVRAAGGRAEAVQANLGEPDEVAQLFDKAERALGQPDILVNNAGLYEQKPVDQIDLAHYERVFAVNVRGCLLASVEAARRLRDGGRIVNISSGGARAASPGGSVYAASKAAVEALTRCHAVDLGPRGVTVNAVAPGLTETDMMRGNGWPQEIVDAMVRQTSLGRLGRPDDIADVVVFLCGNEARWITGQVIDANGGLRG